MRPAHATYRGGHVAFDGPVNWPDGIRVVVVPEHDEMESVGITESEWPQTDDQRRDWLAWHDSREPLGRKRCQWDGKGGEKVSGKAPVKTG